MIRRRALAAGIEIKIGRNTFRATGITAYLDDRRLEIAQQMGAHESALTTGLCAPPQRRQRTSALNLPITRTFREPDVLPHTALPSALCMGYCEQQRIRQG